MGYDVGVLAALLDAPDSALVATVAKARSKNHLLGYDILLAVANVSDSLASVSPDLDNEVYEAATDIAASRVHLLITDMEPRCQEMVPGAWQAAFTSPAACITLPEPTDPSQADLWATGCVLLAWAVSQMTTASLGELRPVLERAWAERADNPTSGSQPRRDGAESPGRQTTKSSTAGEVVGLAAGLAWETAKDLGRKADHYLVDRSRGADAHRAAAQQTEEAARRRSARHATQLQAHAGMVICSDCSAWHDYYLYYGQLFGGRPSHLISGITCPECRQPVPIPTSVSTPWALACPNCDHALLRVLQPAPPRRHKRQQLGVDESRPQQRRRIAWLVLGCAAVGLITSTYLIVNQPGPDAVGTQQAVSPQPSATSEAPVPTSAESAVATSPTVRVETTQTEATPAVVRVPAPVAVATTDQAVWVSNAEDDTIMRIDPTTSQVSATIEVGSAPIGLATTADAVWVTYERDDEVTRIDPDTNQVAASIVVGPSHLEVAATDNAVWVTGYADDTLTRIDPTTNQVTATIGVGITPMGVAATQTAVWVANYGQNTVMRVDPNTNQVTATIDVGIGPNQIAATENDVWVANSEDGSLTRIDPTSNQATATIRLDHDPLHVAATDTTVWVTYFSGQALSRIDSSSGRIVDIDVDGSPTRVAATSTAVWMTSRGTDTVTRIDAEGG